MIRLLILVIYVVSFSCPSTCIAQSTGQGNLFIIGGGKRPAALMKAMTEVARLSPGDYIAVLPMASIEPDTAFSYFVQSMKGVTSSSILNFNSDSLHVLSSARLDSLRRAKLIFITGGDQARFMQIALKNEVYDCIRDAYRRGSCIAGTSAGAAVMSEQMITGAELLGDTSYNETYKKIWDNNLQTSRGLGLLSKTIIDQHFIVRSRYNRLISALAEFPSFTCIGIDESTAVHIHGLKATVFGSGQVVVMSDPRHLEIKNKKLITLSGMRFSIYTDGQAFRLKP